MAEHRSGSHGLSDTMNDALAAVCRIMLKAAVSGPFKRGWCTAALSYINFLHDAKIRYVPAPDLERAGQGHLPLAENFSTRGRHLTCPLRTEGKILDMAPAGFFCAGGVVADVSAS